MEGVVQGVEFRPFAKRLTDRFDLPDITFNTASGLIIEIETDQPNDALRFLEAIQAEAPAAAHIEQYSMQQLSAVVGYKDFRIMASAARNQSFTLISADLATCPACLEEVRNQSDRRFRYPFTNCTNCGPRYSITISTPYEDTVQNTPIFEENGPDNFKGVDIMRAVRSFDPCLPCGVHMYLGNGKMLDAHHSPMFGVQGSGVGEH